MNGFLNGIMQVWQKLPPQSKSVIVDNLSVKQKNFINLGSQIMQYYVDANQQNIDPNIQDADTIDMPTSPNSQAKGGRTRRRGHASNYQETSNHSNIHQANRGNTSSVEDDDDVIEAVWSEKK
jgi:hypothetical protein